MSKPIMAVTGASGALGRAVVAEAVAAGWDVAAIDRAKDRPAQEGSVAFGGVDLTDAQSAEAAMASIIARFGRLDALINVAGGFVWQTVDDAAPQWDRMFALNLNTALNASRAALPHLKAAPEGRIINIGAAGAIKAAAGMGAYAASKAAVHRLTESLAEELKADSRVTVNAVLPSFIDTAANRADMPDADPSKWVAPADLARSILFLASPEGRAITGALIPVTGRV